MVVVVAAAVMCTVRLPVAGLELQLASPLLRWRLLQQLQSCLTRQPCRGCPSAQQPARHRRCNNSSSAWTPWPTCWRLQTAAGQPLQRCCSSVRVVVVEEGEDQQQEGGWEGMTLVVMTTTCCLPLGPSACLPWCPLCLWGSTSSSATA